MIFRTTSETKKDKAVARAHQAGGAATAAGEHAGESIKALAGSLIHSVSETVGPRAEAASAVARERAHQASDLAKERAALASDVAKDRSKVARERAAVARDRAVSGLDHGIDHAVPRVQDGIAGVAPRIDHARDTLVEDLLPKLQELIGSVQTAKDDVLSRQHGAVAAVTGAPKKKSRKGGVLITLGLLAAVGAAVSYYLSQKSEDDVTDPWAGTDERPIGGAPGVDSQVRTAAAADAAEADAVQADLAGTTEEVPVALIETDDVPGTDPDARTGFGTDFGADGDKPRD